jgi:hypothetical protein
MSELPMRGHFRYLRFKNFPMTPRTPNARCFAPCCWALNIREPQKTLNLQLFQVLGFTPTLGQSGVATPIPLLKQKQMWNLEIEEMESSSKIDLRDVLWWMLIKDACRSKVPITPKFSKKGCISLVTRGRPSHVARKHDWNKCGPP